MTSPLMSYYVPTATGYAHARGNRQRGVWMRSSKHGGLFVLPGGRLEPDEEPQLCIGRELTEEVGGEGGKGAVYTVTNLLFTATCPHRDRRRAKLGKLTFNTCPEDQRDLEVLGIYGCPDHVFMSVFDGEPARNDAEADEVVVRDLSEIPIEKVAPAFRAYHRILTDWFKTSRLPSAAELADLRQLGAL